MKCKIIIIIIIIIVIIIINRLPTSTITDKLTTLTIVIIMLDFKP